MCYVDAVTMVMSLFSGRQKLEPRTDIWNQEVSSKAIFPTGINCNLLIGWRLEAFGAWIRMRALKMIGAEI